MPAIVGCRDGFQSRAPWVGSEETLFSGVEPGMHEPAGPAPSNGVFYQQKRGPRRPRDSRQDAGAILNYSPPAVEALVYGLRVLRSDCYFLFLLAHFLVNERDGVVARRQALDLILAIFGR